MTRRRLMQILRHVLRLEQPDSPARMMAMFEQRAAETFGPAWTMGVCYVITFKFVDPLRGRRIPMTRVYMGENVKCGSLYSMLIHARNDGVKQVEMHISWPARSVQ